MKAKIIFAVVLALLVLSPYANASVVTIDFEDTGVGLYESLVYPNVPFFAIADTAQISKGNQLNFADISFLGIGNGNVLYTFPSDIQIIDAQFASPTNFVRIENPLHGQNGGEIDVITAAAFDSSNHLLGEVTQSPGDQ